MLLLATNIKKDEAYEKLIKRGWHWGLRKTDSVAQELFKNTGCVHGLPFDRTQGRAGHGAKDLKCNPRMIYS